MDVISDLCLNKAYIKSYLKNKLSETLCYCAEQEDTFIKFNISRWWEPYEIGSVEDIKSILNELDFEYSYTHELPNLDWKISGFIPNSNLNRARVVYWFTGNYEHSGFQLSAMISLI